MPQARRGTVHRGQYGHVPMAFRSRAPIKCKFFYSKKGCRKGVHCKFSHGTVGEDVPITSVHAEVTDEQDISANEQKQSSLEEAKGPSPPPQDRIDNDHGRVNNSSSHAPSDAIVPMMPTQPVTPIESSMSQLTNQINIISKKIGESITASCHEGRDHDCTACNEHVRTMKQLQLEFQVAIQTVNTMTASLGVLQSHANLVHKSLEALSFQVCSYSREATAASSSSLARISDDSTSTAETNNDDNSIVGKPTSSPAIIVNYVEALKRGDGRGGGLEASCDAPNNANTGISIVHTPVERNESANNTVAQSASNFPSDANTPRLSIVHKTGERKKSANNTVAQSASTLHPAEQIIVDFEQEEEDSVQVEKDFSEADDSENNAPFIAKIPTKRNQSPDTVMQTPLSSSSLSNYMNTEQQNAQFFGGEVDNSNSVVPSKQVSENTSTPLKLPSNETKELCSENCSEVGEGNNCISFSNDEWTCPVCTFINPMLFLACDACGSTAPVSIENNKHSVEVTDQDANVTTGITLPELQQQKEAEKEMRKEERARKRREKVERKKMAKLARKREEEQAAEEVEKQKQLEAKKEKQAAMAKHEKEVQQQRSNLRKKEAQEKKLNAESSPFVPPAAGIGVSNHSLLVNADREKLAVIVEHEQEVLQQQPKKKEIIQQKNEPEVKKLNPKSTPFVSSVAGIDRSIPQRQIPGRKICSTNLLPSAKKKVTVDQLSYYIKSTNPKGSKIISPIFDLLQTESTAEKARQLLVLEGEIQKGKEELKDLVGKRTSLLNGIGFEERIIKQKNNAIEIQKKKIEGWLITAMKELGDARGNLWQKERDEEELKAEEEPSEVKVEETIEGIEFDSIPTLDELLERGSSFLTCSASKYALWLNDQGIETSTDLGIAVIEKDIASMTSNDGYGVKLESFEAFTTLVLYAVTGKKRSIRQETDLDKKKKKKIEVKAIKEKIAKNHGQVKKKETTVDSKDAGIRIAEHRKVIAKSEEGIKEMKQSLEVIQTLLNAKLAHLQKLRADIAAIKGKGKYEDVNFHIDKSRDDRGFTFLMIAAQNDDFYSAKTCLELGADPHMKSPEGLTAVDFSFFFQYKHVTDLILRNGGSLPPKQSEAWTCLRSMTLQSADSAKSWDDALKVAETAALPAETLMESPDKCEADKYKRMDTLTDQECSSMDFTCFESRLCDPNINSDQVHRIVLLEQHVYNWCLSTDKTTRSNFINVLEGLKPASLRKPGVNATKVHRRAVVGTTTTFEVLASRFEDVSTDGGKDEVVLFSPFVSGEVEAGVSSIGVLVWAVVPDSEASLYKTLVTNTDFMRNRIERNDRFLPHLDENGVLKLGKDMHLLDLHSTSIWTTAAMDLYILNVDCGDLENISCAGFSAKKRIIHSEEQVNKAIFRTSQEEAEKNNDILANERLDMSSLVSGGAGTGKTLLMIRKVSSEDPSRRILVVSRLPRLVNIIKTAVEEKRDDSIDNSFFHTYDDLVQLLARRVVPDEDSEYKSFVQFNRVRFDCDDSNISFMREFITDFLNSKERRQMTSHQIEPLTLWHAIIVIKSNAKCASTKAPLSLDDYISLPTSFGLTEVQRGLCYDLFLKYEQWREDGQYWDEMDRVLYVIRHGPTVFREDRFIPWAARVNKFGEMDLLDDEGAPLYPFFYDVVCADEAQDFTEIDLVLFAKMSSSIRSLFLSADVAQSVELGISMRAGTVNDVFHSLLKDGKRQVKDVLQYVDLRTNHRTHQQNLVIGQAIRSILARSFSIPMSHEAALINGEIPKTMMIRKIRDLADASVFQGGNIVFLAPDEKVHELRLQFQALEIHNDLFGVREAKGLEFDACALIGFFGYIDELGSREEWQNALRWLSSSSSITKTSSTGEKVDGLMLTDCDYRLSAPNVSDEAMMLYTALTRARNRLYLIEVESTGKGKKPGKPLAQYAFRRLSDLKLAKSVTFIKEGHAEMTPAQHKARGVLYVTQALNMSSSMEPLSSIENKFTEAMNRFGPDKGNDKELLDKCEKHLNAVIQMRNLMRSAKEKFPGAGCYNLEGRFAEVLQFEQEASNFFSEYLCDSFLVAEVQSVRLLIEEVFDGTPYEKHFREICAAVKNLEEDV